jgi:hypothetical protein
VVEHLPSMCETPSSNPSSAKNKKGLDLNKFLTILIYYVIETVNHICVNAYVYIHINIFKSTHNCDNIHPYV